MKDGLAIYGTRMISETCPGLQPPGVLLGKQHHVEGASPGGGRSLVPGLASAAAVQGFSGQLEKDGRDDDRTGKPVPDYILCSAVSGLVRCTNPSGSTEGQ